MQEVDLHMFNFGETNIPHLFGGIIMRFGEKLREQRQSRGLSQGDLAKELGVTTRTLGNYESGSSHPKDRKIYYKLAEIFDLDVNYFLTEDEAFLSTVSEHYGKRGVDRAKIILDEAAALFAGGELSETDQIAFLHDMQRLFLDSKEKTRTKYTPKKYRSKPSTE